MSNKMECPGCNAYTSSVLQAVEDGDACPSCGLSAEAIVAVHEARKSRADAELKEQLEQEIVRSANYRAEAEKLRRSIAAVRRALNEVP